jgi:two-component system response regulator AtoC
MFAFADGGTVFLKEVWALPDFLQGKLIKYLEISKPAAEDADAPEQSADLRIIASTTRDLADLAGRGRFRTDLLHRLDVIRLNIPPLRERAEDIAPLTDFFIDKYCLEFGRSRLELSEEIRGAMQTCVWLENVSELEQMVRRAVLRGDDNGMCEELRSGNRHRSCGMNTETRAGSGRLAGQEEIRQYLRETSDFSLKGVRQEFMLRAERRFIKKALEKANWNRKKAARMLEISYKSLLNKMKEFDLS